MKIQVKDVYEGSKENKTFLGKLYVESCKGRLDRVLMKFIDDGEIISQIHKAYGTSLVESLVDDQILHHQATTAFKAKASKNDPAEGLERLPWEAKASRVLYRQPWASANVELGEGQEGPADPDETDVVRINWEYVPGQSAAAIKKAQDEADKKRRYEEGVTHQIELMKEFTGAWPTEEQLEKIKTLVRQTVYGS